MKYYENIAALIDAHHRAHQVPYLHSGPGTGKSAFMEWMAERGTISAGDTTVPVGGVIRLVPHTMDKGDLLGIPTLRDITYEGEKFSLTDFATPSWIYDAVTTADATGGVVYVLFDEFSRCYMETQNALLNVISERVMPNGFPIPPSILFVCAGNDSADDRGVMDLSAAMTSRLAHYDFDPDLDSWLTGLVGGFGKTLTPRQSKWRSMIAAYLRANPDAVTDETAKTDRSRGWANRRTWTNAADMMAQLPDDLTGSGLSTISVDDDGNLSANLSASTDPDFGFQYRALVGLLGKHTVAPLVEFLNNLSVPSPDDLLADPTLLDNITSDVAYAALTNAASTVKNTEAGTWEAHLSRGASEAEARNTMQSREQSPYLSLVNVLNYATGEHADIAMAVTESAISDMVKFCGVRVIGGKKRGKDSRPALMIEKFGPIADAVTKAQGFLSDSD